MNKDLLSIYLRNHLSVFYLPAFVVTFVLWLRFYLYSYPDSQEITVGIFLFSVAAIFFVRQQLFYKKLLSSADYSYRNTLLLIAINKIGYIFPWLVIIFWPFYTNYMFDHLVGFAFVFFTVGAYVALSSSCLILFVLDVFLQLFAAVIILFINRYSIEVPYIAAALTIFTFYAGIIAAKLNNSSKELVLTNLKLSEAAAEAREANMAKSDFLSMISHEIRTPLHGIMSTIEHLSETKIDDKQRESLQVVTRCSETLLAMLNDVLDLSKIEAKKVEVEEISFNLPLLVHDVINIVKYSAEEKGIELSAKINKDVPEKIKSDQVKIQQILLNLLSNALKFTEKGSICVDVSFDAHGNNILISVEDTGIGISNENQKKLFSHFVQADNSISRKYGGTGLGLSIAKSFAVLLGGDISVKSEVGRGSAFSLIFPYVPADVGITEGGSVAVSFDGFDRQLSVLVAEDNAINQKTVERILLDSGCFVTLVENGEQAITQLEKQEFDLVLMDMNMPVMDGIVATKKIKNHENNAVRSVPVLGLTAATEERMISAFYDAGIANHITKPFRKNDFISIIASTLGLSEIKNSGDKVDGISKKLNEIKEDFGEDFYISFVEDSIEEIERLWGLVEQAYTDKNMKALYQHAHDLCAVSGNIGMEQSYKCSKALELAASNAEEESLAILVEEAQKALKIDLEQVKAKIIN